MGRSTSVTPFRCAVPHGGAAAAVRCAPGWGPVRLRPNTHGGPGKGESVRRLCRRMTAGTGRRSQADVCVAARNRWSDRAWCALGWRIEVRPRVGQAPGEAGVEELLGRRARRRVPDVELVGSPGPRCGSAPPRTAPTRCRGPRTLVTPRGEQTPMNDVSYSGLDPWLVEFSARLFSVTVPRPSPVRLGISPSISRVTLTIEPTGRVGYPMTSSTVSPRSRAARGSQSGVPVGAPEAGVTRPHRARRAGLKALAQPGRRGSRLPPPV